MFDTFPLNLTSSVVFPHLFRPVFPRRLVCQLPGRASTCHLTQPVYYAAFTPKALQIFHAIRSDLKSICGTVHWLWMGFAFDANFRRVVRMWWIEQSEKFASFAFNFAEKCARRWVAKANQRWDAPPLVNLTVCCYSSSAGRGCYSDVVSGSHWAEWAYGWSYV